MRQSLYEAEVVRVCDARIDGAHGLGHLRRVWTMAHRMAVEIGGTDLEVIEAAAFLHDIINPSKDSPDRKNAAQLSANHARRFLQGLEFPLEKLDNVAHAIEAHSFSGGLTPLTLEAQIVQDADRLEALGALGVARCFNVSGQMGGELFHAEDPLALNRPLDDRAYALDHFEVKLLRIIETMNTERAQQIATERADFVRDFRDQLLREIS